MMRCRNILLVCLFAVPSLALAEEVSAKPGVSIVQARRVAANNRSCTMNERASLNISFGARAASLKDARQKFDSYLNEIDAIIKQSDAKKWEMQSMNYSLNEQGGGEDMEPKFSISGNVSYQTENADDAFAVMEKLSAKKMRVNVNVNKYRNCSSANYIE